MRDQQLRVIKGTTSDIQAAEGPCDVWGIIIEGTTTAIARVDLYDHVSTSGTIIVSITTNTPNGTNFEKTTGVMFPRPVRFSKALSIDMTGTENFWVYVTGVRLNV